MTLKPERFVEASFPLKLRDASLFDEFEAYRAAVAGHFTSEPRHHGFLRRCFLAAMDKKFDKHMQRRTKSVRLDDRWRPAVYLVSTR
jgi:hypothetical protein